MAENTDPEFTAEDLAAQEAEAERKRLEARDALLAMQQIENQVASPTVGPTLLNRRGQPYSGSAMAPVSAPLLENPESVGPAPLSLPLAPGHGRMYMGPASGARLDEWNAGIGPSSVNLVPPPTGPSLTRLQELQALQKPDSTGFQRSTTIGIRDEDPLSDFSMARGSNMMVVNARMQVAADQAAGKESSPQTLMAAMGGGSTGMFTPAQAAAAADRRRVQDWREQQAEQAQAWREQQAGAQTMTETFDAVRGQAATPGTPERVGFWGGKIPAVPATPGVEARGKLSVTKKVMPPAAAPKMREFKTEAEALKSGVKGIVIINGRKAKID